MANPAIEQHSPGVLHIHVKVVPGASKSELVGAYGERLKVRVTAPAESGKANKAVLTLLASALGLPPTRLDLVRGSSMPLKTIAVDGLTLEAARASLSVEAS